MTDLSGLTAEERFEAIRWTLGLLPDSLYPETKQRALAILAEVEAEAERLQAEHGEPCPGCEVCELATELIEARADFADIEAERDDLRTALEQIERGMLHSEYDPVEVCQRHRQIAREVLGRYPKADT